LFSVDRLDALDYVGHGSPDDAATGKWPDSQQQGCQR
jgi:hypothetical protein